MTNSGIDTKNKTQKKWEGHIKAWQASNLSVSEYVRQAKISASSFHKWKRNLLVSEKRAEAPLFAEITLPRAEQNSEISDLQNLKTSNIILQVKDYRLEIPSNFDMKTLSNLLDCLDQRGVSSCT